jgi:hypothetical protein
MNLLEVKQLEERITGEVQTVLTEGDLDYLKGLSRSALLELLESEIMFLGVYPIDNREAPVVVNRVLEENLDYWREIYLGKKRGE